ncbi:MAG: hypothetical protein CVU21_06655 [Betaproteobacteria bacterium HGW-Betaproteobacteria-15]|nr:MAG: hypothetical protein CVU21_06655 [Betaproteobacteria bacterium HGW-Betaproteobacteria-15]
MKEAVLALLDAFKFDNGRVWKRYCFSVMGAHHKQRFITYPRGHRESLPSTEEGRLKAQDYRYLGAGSGR